LVGRVVILQQSYYFVSHEEISNDGWRPRTNVITTLHYDSFIRFSISLLNKMERTFAFELNRTVLIASSLYNFSDFVVSDAVDCNVNFELLYQRK
jgi:hypothetical protein